MAHVINLTQEILKNIKAGDAQEEDELLELVSQEEQEDDVNVEIIPKLRRHQEVLDWRLMCQNTPCVDHRQKTLSNEPNVNQRH